MTLVEFQAEVNRRLADNDQGLITPEDLRRLFALLIQIIREGVDQ